MSYRLPLPTSTACSSAGCDTVATCSDVEPGARAAAFSGWHLGPETAMCPAHASRRSVLDFAAA